MLKVLGLKNELQGMYMLKYSLALYCAIISVNFAVAEIAQNTVATKDRTYVMDSNGECVRTKWMVPGNKCQDSEVVEQIEMSKIEERIILFDFDKSDITPDYVTSLNKLIEILNHNKITHIKIVGYTDRIGTDVYNQKLSQKRAEAVNTYLNNNMKLESSLIELRSMGKTNQFASCDGMKGSELITCLMPNRRVEVEIDYNFHDQKTVIIPWEERMNDPKEYEDEITK